MIAGKKRPVGYAHHEDEMHDVCVCIVWSVRVKPYQKKNTLLVLQVAACG